MSEPEPADTTRDKKNVGKRKSLKQILKKLSNFSGHPNTFRTHSGGLRSVYRTHPHICAASCMQLCTLRTHSAHKFKMTFPSFKYLFVVPHTTMRAGLFSLFRSPHTSAHIPHTFAN